MSENEERVIRRCCVFSGSSPGGRPEYRAAASALGEVLLEEGIGLVYGGARVGLMGVTADVVLAGGGEVIGVIPEALQAQGVAHEGLSELRVVDSMHARKHEMAELADTFVALPGGLGTFEELLEVLTWAQLGDHAKPCAALDVCGYFQKLAGLLDQAVSERFLKPVHRDLLIMASEPRALLAAIRNAPRVNAGKWLDRGSQSGLSAPHLSSK